jgi:general secretion pathway protein D
MRRRLLILVLLALSGVLLQAQRIKEMEFRDQAIADILLVLAEASGKSIIPDETVAGNASFRFADAEFETALGQFLAAHRLHYTIKDGAYHVSRIAASYDKERGLVSLSADGVELQLLVRALSRAIGVTVLYDPLPREALAVDIDSVPPDTALGILIRRFPEYALESEPSFRYIRKKQPLQDRPQAAKKEEAPPIVRTGDEYSITLEKGRFLETVVQLFAAAGKEYSLLTKADSQVENLYFSGRPFDELLRLLLEQGNADFVVSGGVYYITELQRRDVVKKLKTTRIVPLSYVQAQELPNLLPGELAAGNAIRVDKNANCVILTGSDEELRPIEAFIALVDRPLEGRSYVRFDVKYLKVKDLLAVVPQKLLPVAPVVLPEGNSFVVLATEENRRDLERFIAGVDRKSGGLPVRLRYIKTEELLKNLPPSVSKEDVVDSGSPNLVFFTGSEDKWRLFMRELSLVDRPKPQVRYELLVIQYQAGSNATWQRGLDVSEAAKGGDVSFLGGISNVLSLKFDVVSQFGYLFAAKLSMEMGSSKARVFADTTLNGLSGQEVKFQNTSTFRYRETEIDEDTGKTKLTGVTREITSGLIVGLNGWVSGDGMVTMTVGATVSKRGSDTSSSTGDPPPTSERVVSTQIRTSSGTPVIIGGLLQKETTRSVKKVPLLGDIPLLGWLFKDVVSSEEDTEFVLYVVPHIAWGDADAASEGGGTERYYQSYVKGFVR